MSLETESLSEQNTPRYFYARERSPLWSSYRTYASLKSDIARRNDISHLATPTCFTESRLRRAKDPEVVTNDIYESVRHKLKCLNCGLKGHTILKCDKISRFSDLNCREPSTGSFSDSEDNPMGMFRRSFSTRKSTDRYSTGSFNIQKEVNSEANYPKLPKCRLCGLKGHMSLNCHRDGSPNHKKLSVPFPSHLSFIESPYFVKRRFGNGNSFDSPVSEINGAYLQNGYHNHPHDTNTIPKTTFLTPLRVRQDLETIPDTESPSSKSLPVRLKSPRTKRVRIDPNNSDLSNGDASVRRRPTLTGAETDNDSGLGFCSSSDVDAGPMDMFEILESSIRQYEKEFDEKLRFDIDENDLLRDENDQCFEGSSVNGETNGSNESEKPNKKLHKLRLKLIKSWFKKSVQK